MRTYCNEVMSGGQVYMVPDPGNPGKYCCAGCGASEEVVMDTAEAADRYAQEQWTKNGINTWGMIPDLLKPYAIDGDPLNITNYKEPWIETKGDSGRSLKEIELMQKEARGAT